MKILMFGMSSYPGGTENYIRNIFFHREISNSIKIDFITYENDLAYSDEMEQYGYRVLRVPHLKRHPIGYFKAVKKLMKAEKYDAVYVNMLCAANPLPVFFAKLSKVPQIILHAHSSSTVKGLIRGILHSVCKGYMDKNATLRLACSQKASDWLFNEKNSKSDIKVIPNAINADRYCFLSELRNEIRSKYNIDDNELVLGSVGRFGPEKNNLFMLEILDCIKKKNISAKLLLVGDGALRSKIEKKIEELNLSDSVILAGTIVDPYKYYSAFDVFLFPSTFEGFGIAGLEAQSCGLPCFCSDAISEELNITNTLSYLPVSLGAEVWAERILNIETEYDKNLMNEQVKKSDYNLNNQRKNVQELIYGK